MTTPRKSPARRMRPAGRPAAAPVACLVSLGCEKNTVDSERILAILVRDGFLIAADPMDADVCLVNTCGFIHDAREETAATLRNLAARRRRSSRPKILALGCMVERAADVPELAEVLSAADATAGFLDYPRLPDLCRGLAGAPAARSGTETSGGLAGFHALPRLLSGPGHTTALKISEGCSNACRFCTIPAIRGPQVSRPPADILEEARDLIRSGVREICLIGQDTTSYGRDLTPRRSLSDLMCSLSEDVPDDVWFRLMYVHPRFLNDAVLDALAADPRWQPYLDIPLQHIADGILRAMGRGMGRDDTLRTLDRIRSRLPDLCMRTAFIVGHPGETESDFNELASFVREGRFMHAGVFVYSEEPGTPSARMENPVPIRTAQKRRDVLMRIQRDMSRARLKTWIGRELNVLVDGPRDKGAPGPASAAWVGRHGGQAPDVDGMVFVETPANARLSPGDRIRVRITGSTDYDLVAQGYITGARETLGADRADPTRGPSSPARAVPSSG